MAEHDRGGTWRYYVWLAAVFALASILPIAGVTIGTRVWRAGGALSPRRIEAAALDRIKTLPFSNAEWSTAPDANAATFHGTSGGFSIRGEVLPARPLVGKIQIRLETTDMRTGEPVRGAAVNIWFAREGEWLLRAPALNSPANPDTYFANVEIDQPGDWLARLVIESPSWTGVLDLSISVAARARSGAGLRDATLVYLGAAVMIALGVAWLTWSARRARHRAARTFIVPAIDIGYTNPAYCR